MHRAEGSGQTVEIVFGLFIHRWLWDAQGWHKPFCSTSAPYPVSFTLVDFINSKFITQANNGDTIGSSNMLKLLLSPFERIIGMCSR